MNIMKVNILVLSLALAINAAYAGDDLLRKSAPAALKHPAKSALNGMANAGDRLVAIGARGAITLSDDGGSSWRQAKDVPVSSTLTAVDFIDEKHGWVVGHDGVVLASIDGGENWTLQNWDDAIDQPFFGVHFFNADEGIVVGLWSRIMKTKDGGKTWTNVALPSPPPGAKKDLNFYKVFGGTTQAYIAAESGWVLRSNDKGHTWSYANVGTKASLWTGDIKGESVWVGGLLGKIFHSIDSGKTWVAVQTKIKTSITSIKSENQNIAIVGLDGNITTSKDGGRSFLYQQLDARAAITDMHQDADGKLILATQSGVMTNIKSGTRK
jgi:photosystem II stability/assembly factor-like uncharacterized protein